MSLRLALIVIYLRVMNTKRYKLNSVGQLKSLSHFTDMSMTALSFFVLLTTFCSAEPFTIYLNSQYQSMFSDEFESNFILHFLDVLKIDRRN